MGRKVIYFQSDIEKLIQKKKGGKKVIRPATKITLARLLQSIHSEADNADDLRETIQLFQREAKKLQDKLVNMSTQKEEPKKTIPYNDGIRIA